MHRGTMALVGAVVFSWSATGLAASLADRAVGFEGSFTSPGMASPGLHPLDASSLHLMPAGDQGGEGAVKTDDQIRSLLAVALTFFVGFGVGHFVVGDGAAWLFLGLNVGVIVGMVAVYAAAYAVAIGMVGIPYFVFIAVPILGLAAMAIRIWELVDILFKSGIVGSGPKTSEVILPRGGELARSAFQPAMANGLNLRF